MKIDLEDIDRKARSAKCDRRSNGRWFVVGPPWGDGTHVVAGNEDPHAAHYVVADVDLIYDDDHGPDAPESVDLAQHIAANCPDVTLALIARIRELEELLAVALRKAAESSDPESIGTAGYLRALLEKGAVIP